MLCDFMRGLSGLKLYVGFVVAPIVVPSDRISFAILFCDTQQLHSTLALVYLSFQDDHDIWWSKQTTNQTY